MNQRKHYRDQLGPDGPLAPKAVGPYRISQRITKNTFELAIPTKMVGKMPVFHSSELIPYETRELDPVGALPPREESDKDELLPHEAEELDQAVQFPLSVGDGRGTSSVNVDQDFSGPDHVPPDFDQQFGEAVQAAVQYNWMDPEPVSAAE